MSHFYANIHGNKGEATRCGTKGSGMVSHTRGWTIGAKVVCDHSHSTGLDTIYISVTNGSNGYQSRLLAWITEGDNQVHIAEEFTPQPPPRPAPAPRPHNKDRQIKLDTEEQS